MPDISDCLPNSVGNAPILFPVLSGFPQQVSKHSLPLEDYS